MKFNIQEIIRFGIVGVIATIIHYEIYLVLNLIITSWIAYSIGYGISFLGNFYLSNRFTFKTKPTFKKGVGFGLSHFINYLLQVILLSIFIKLGMPDKYAPIPVFCIAVPINFLMVRFVLKSKNP
jgi:putative flippase GtrA